MLTRDETRAALAIPPLWRLAFRPLFLGGSLFSILAVAWWAYFWSGTRSWQLYGNPIWWHGHEMLFGFATAIVVGFLLTAVQTWTGVTGVRARPLMGLVSLWLLGRCLIAFGGALPPTLIAVVDCLFLPTAALALARPLVRVRQWRNAPLVVLLLVLAIINIASHGALLSDAPRLAIRTLHAAVLSITLIMAVMGGRVIPFFTARGTSTERTAPLPWLDVASLGSLAALLVASAFGLATLPAGWLTALALPSAMLNTWRFARWGFWRTRRVPLLWSLHLAYAFIPLGLLALALAGSPHLVGISTAMHCFSAGAMGSLILAMVARVSLGHTGRPLQAPRAMPLAFVLIVCSAVVRLAAAFVAPGLALEAIMSAGVLWVLAYGIYCWHYAPMLWTARIDGRPG